MVAGFTTYYAISAYHHHSCEFQSHSWRGVLDTTIYDKVCQWLVTDQRFSPVSSTNKTDRHDIAEILLKVALNTIHQAKPNAFIYFFFQIQGTSVHCSSKHKFNVFASTYWICLPSLKLFVSWLGVLDTISCVCRWLMLVSCVSPSILEYLLEKQLNLRVSYSINEKCIKMFEAYKVMLATVRKTNLCFL